MEAIFSSKMFRSSKNQDKIRAAINDPLNKELVQQLRSYLDPEYRNEEFLDDNEVKKDIPNSEDEKIIDSPASKSSNPPPAARPKLSEKLESAPENPESPEVPQERQEDYETEEDKEVVTEESTSVNRSSKILASSAAESVASTSDAIRGLLDSRQETSGVVRMMIKDSELWIHYADSINLNNVMEPVIALLNSAGYTHLNFNRLARTENAIVFYINEIAAPVEPMDSENAQEK